MLLKDWMHVRQARPARLMVIEQQLLLQLVVFWLLQDSKGKTLLCRWSIDAVASGCCLGLR